MALCYFFVATNLRFFLVFSAFFFQELSISQWKMFQICINVFFFKKIITKIFKLYGQIWDYMFLRMVQHRCVSQYPEHRINSCHRGLEPTFYPKRLIIIFDFSIFKVFAGKVEVELDELVVVYFDCHMH